MSLNLIGNAGLLTVDSTNGITFPNGTNPQSAPGKILQVVQFATSTYVSTTSSSYVTTGLTASITPLFSTSKVLVLISAALGFSTSTSGTLFATLYRNSTNLGGGSYASFNDIYVGTSNSVYLPALINYLDSPATTSSTSYTYYFQSYNNTDTARFNPNSQTSTIILMEIAA
jgi:hypothetical protein